MHVYVIFAHPSQRSFSRSVLDAFTRGLGGMMPLDDSHRAQNLRRAYELGRTF